MEGIEEVRQLSDKRLFWWAQLLGKTEEWEAEIYEQIVDERIAWRSVTGAPNSGVVAFVPLDEMRTQVNLSISYQPEGAVEKIGDALGLVSSRVDGDLHRFKEFIEERRLRIGSAARFQALIARQ